jgi:hypothetical protein
MTWKFDDGWGTRDTINNTKSQRLSNADRIEKQIIQKLSKNSKGFKVEHYKSYDSNGNEVAQTILTRNKKVRCPDIFASHKDSWDEISLRVEVKSHDTMSIKDHVFVDCEKFQDYYNLQSSEEVESRIYFIIMDDGREYWQTLDILNRHKKYHEHKMKNGNVLDVFIWNVKTLNRFTTSDDFFKDVQI